MKKIMPLVLLLLACTFYCFSQADTTVARVQKKVASATNPSEKVDAMYELAYAYFLQDPKTCQETVDNMIFVAEGSRDRALMAKSRRYAANIFASADGLKEYAEKARKYAFEALEICKKESGLQEEKVLCYMLMARTLRNENKFAEARKYNEQAISGAGDLGSDSLKVVSRVGYANTLLNEGEKLDGLKAYLAAQAIAENSKQPSRQDLIAITNASLSSFYTSLEDYDRAIDYQFKVLNHSKQQNKTDEVLRSYVSIGKLYMAAKKYDAAKKTFEQIIATADSLKKESFKVSGQIGIVNVLLEQKDAKQSLGYLNAHPEIKKTFEKYNMYYQLDFGLGQAFATLGQKDSAKFYFDKSLPLMVSNATLFSLPQVYSVYGKHLYGWGEFEKAAAYFLKAEKINDSTNVAMQNLNVYEMLDSCYQKMNDYKSAFRYSGLHKKLKIEVDEKSKAKDILALEVDAENKRIERIKLEEEEAKIRRHNIQYTGIVVGIISLFVILTMLGFLKVPLKWIRIMGFISFIFLFEFIIFLADTWIHHATHGEPLKVLGIKVVLIAMLLPLHHFLEHKVIHYLSHRWHNKVAEKLA